MYQHTARKPNGYVEAFSPDGKKFEADTLQCCHCGGHFIVRPGSGTKRGWCLKCNKPTCGKPECDKCVPTEKQIEEIERRSQCVQLRLMP
jgi:hypothetical protein